MEAWEYAFREWRKKLRDEGVTCPDFKQAFMAGWIAGHSAELDINDKGNISNAMQQ